MSQVKTGPHHRLCTKIVLSYSLPAPTGSFALPSRVRKIHTSNRGLSSSEPLRARSKLTSVSTTTAATHSTDASNRHRTAEQPASRPVLRCASTTRRTIAVTYFYALSAGILIGGVYALLRVKSPAPPIAALIGLAGMLLAGLVLPQLL
jgi:XapX domain-containing protein